MSREALASRCKNPPKRRTCTMAEDVQGDGGHARKLRKLSDASLNHGIIISEVSPGSRVDSFENRQQRGSFYRTLSDVVETTFHVLGCILPMDSQRKDVGIEAIAREIARSDFLHRFRVDLAIPETDSRRSRESEFLRPSMRSGRELDLYEEEQTSNRILERISKSDGIVIETRLRKAGSIGVSKKFMREQRPDWEEEEEDREVVDSDREEVDKEEASEEGRVEVEAARESHPEARAVSEEVDSTPS
ncbi:unnamed protein product [Darwinula stevensoni]|uniref:Uncharacterized protein n=1 Tax=Darwinula stevensoni TaxID=69355 RepID=A0A7R8ZXK9_9CRUS|nr:unnamed protein product [Darwinula stevensoni]CAG0879591.1 unnamed protein product [Darwinula stevensoni]